MKICRLGFLALFFLLPIAGQAEEHFPGASWQHLPTDKGGWSSFKLAKAETWSQQIGLNAVMVVQHGLVVAQWGHTEWKTPLASVRKSLLNSLIGVAVGRHQIDLDATLGDLGIDDNAPSLSPEEKTATVRDLLEARSGVYHPALYETRRMAELRPARFGHEPGKFWYYNNWDFNVLGAIYERAVGSSIYEAFEREVARPIGMEDYRPSDGTYVSGAASIYPAYTFLMSARDLARFALLYLNDGRWGDRQLVPADWVQTSTHAYSQSGFGPGYGYLWWTGFADNSVVPIVKLAPGSFFAWGNGGQFAFVMPADDLIVVSRDGDPDLREIGRLLWLILDAAGLPNIGPDASIEAAHGTREDGAAMAQLFAGASLIFGDTTMDGPFRIRLDHDGGAVLLKGPEETPSDTGSWSIDGNKFCRDWQKTKPYHACFAVVRDMARVGLFDSNGLMVIEARLVAQ
jgi:CubicO group peptidase (beta-lactamase class C family)